MISQTTEEKQLAPGLLEDLLHVFEAQSCDIRDSNTTPGACHEISSTTTAWAPETVRTFKKHLKQGKMEFHHPLYREMADEEWKKWYGRALAPVTMKDLQTIVDDKSFPSSSPRSGKPFEPAFMVSV